MAMDDKTVLLILFLVAVCASVHGQGVSIVFSRPTESNQVTLTCRDSNYLPLTNANFWLNSSQLSSVLSSSEYTVPANGKIEFTIRWDLEGLYSCGRSNTESNELELVGKGVYKFNHCLTLPHAVMLCVCVCVWCV